MIFLLNWVVKIQNKSTGRAATREVTALPRLHLYVLLGYCPKAAPSQGPASAASGASASRKSRARGIDAVTCGVIQVQDDFLFANRNAGGVLLKHGRRILLQRGKIFLFREQQRTVPGVSRAW